MLSVVSTETSSTSLVTMEAAPEEKGPKMNCANCANCANSHWMPRAGDQSFGHQGFSSRLLRNLQNLQNPGSLPNLATGRSRKPESRNLRNLPNP
jgi:hypothetical protein